MLVQNISRGHEILKTFWNFGAPYCSCVVNVHAALHCLSLLSACVSLHFCGSKLFPACTSCLVSPCCCFASFYFTFVQRCPSKLLSACTVLHKSPSKLLSACGCCGLPLPVSSALSLVAIQTTSSTKKDFWKLHTEITFEVCGGALTSCSLINIIDSA